MVDSSAPTTAWLPEVLLVIGMALPTFVIRYGPIFYSGRVTLSPRLIDLLRYVPPVVLTAIVVPAVLIPSGTSWELTYTNPRLGAAIAAFLIAWKWNNLLLTITLGMAIFFIWQAL